MIRLTALGTFFRHGPTEGGEDRVGFRLAPPGGSLWSLNATDGLPYLRLAHPAPPARLPVEAERASCAVVIGELLELGGQPAGRPLRHQRGGLAGHRRREIRRHPAGAAWRRARLGPDEVRRFACGRAERPAGMDAILR